MQTEHEDKAIGLQANKGLSARARAIFDRHTSRVGLSADEENEVGRQVSAALEQNDRPSWWPQMQQAAAPTEAEADALAEAEKVYAKAVAKREKARLAVMEAEQELRIARGVSNWNADKDAARHTERAEAALNRAEFVFNQSVLDAQEAARPMNVARAAIHRNGAARQRVLVGRF